MAARTFASASTKFQMPLENHNPRHDADERRVRVNAHQAAQRSALDFFRIEKRWIGRVINRDDFFRRNAAHNQRFAGEAGNSNRLAYTPANPTL